MFFSTSEEPKSRVFGTTRHREIYATRIPSNFIPKKRGCSSIRPLKQSEQKCVSKRHRTRMQPSRFPGPEKQAELACSDSLSGLFWSAIITWEAKYPYLGVLTLSGQGSKSLHSFGRRTSSSRRNRAQFQGIGLACLRGQA